MFSFRNALVAFCAVLSVTAAANAQTINSGMTWSVLAQQGGSVHVGSDGYTNPYGGDTSIDQYLPLLCVNVDGRSAPGGITFDYYNGWLRGAVQVTAPVQGITLSSQARADTVCSDNFGTGWRMAEFHDGRYGPNFSSSGGWSFWGTGELGIGTRVWASINDQPANPWNSLSADDSAIQSLLSSSMQPLLTLAQDPNFRDIVRAGVARQFDGDDNVLMSDVINDAQQSGVIDTNSAAWQSFVANVAQFENINGTAYYPQIYVPNYSEGMLVPPSSTTMVVYETAPATGAVNAYQVDGNGYLTYYGQVDEAWAESNELWVLSINERVDMDQAALKTVRSMDAQLDAQRDAERMTWRNALAAKASGRAFRPATDQITCNPTGLRNNNGMEYLTWYRVPDPGSLESWLQGKLEMRMIVVGLGGAEIGNKYLGQQKRKAIKNGINTEIFLTSWDRAVWGDYWAYKWIEIDKGPKITASLGLTPTVLSFLGATANVTAVFEADNDDAGSGLVTFSESTNITYSTGTVEWKVCSVGGQGGTGNTNLALAAIASASSTYSGYSPARVNDGSRSTALGGANSWSNTGYGAGYPPQWIQLDFGTNRTFSQVVFYTTTAYELRDYRIEYWNGFTWVNVYSPAQTFTINTANQRTHNFPARTSRLVRIYTLSGPTHQQGFTRVNEFEVY
ncbi:MAG TPA: discoidin domain-containing protein [Thermoanaerobaculia bacterium]|nr:discoidin domain-containing protein [Thermoanaerobaculia bacterium]